MSENENTEQKELGRGLILVCSLVLEIGLAVVVFYVLSLSTFLGGLVGGILTLVVSFFLVAYFWWAPNNLCFTFVQEGTAKAVVFGGQFKCILLQWKGHTLDENWKVVREGSRHKESWHPLGGFRFYGIWPFWDIHIYQFSWTAVLESGETKRHDKEWLDYVLLMDDVYWFKVDKAEDADLLPLNVECLVTARIVNPYMALFAVQDWLEAFINRIRPSVRNQMTSKPYKDLTVQTGAIGQDIFMGSEVLRKEFNKRYGIELRAVQVKEIDPPEDLRDITLKKVVAEREAEVVLITAEAEAKAVLIKATAEKERLSRVYGQIREEGDTGVLVRSLEALEKSTGEGGAKWILSPEVLSRLSGIFGGQNQASAEKP